MVIEQPLHSQAPKICHAVARTANPLIEGSRCPRPAALLLYAQHSVFNVQLEVPNTNGLVHLCPRKNLFPCELEIEVSFHPSNLTSPFPSMRLFMVKSLKTVLMRPCNRGLSIRSKRFTRQGSAFIFRLAHLSTLPLT